MNRTAGFIERLLAEVPELTSIYGQHLEDNDTLLPHVFMADVTRFVITLAQCTVDAEVLHRLLSFFEQGLLSGDSDVCELIGVSFVENLCGEDAVVRTLIPLLGDALRSEMRRVCGV